METPNGHALSQYGTSTSRLDARVSLYDFRTGEDWYEWLARHLPVEGTSSAFEVGSGTGRLWTLLRPPPFLVLSDAFTPMCDELRRSAPGFVLRARGESVPIRDNVFDAAIASHVLYHLPDPTAGVRELCRVVHSGGWVAVTSNTVRHFGRFSEMLQELGFPPLGARTHLRFDDEAAHDALSGVARSVESYGYEVDLIVPTVEPALRYVLSTLPARERDRALPLEQRLAEEVREHGAICVRSSAALHVGIAR